ncbi:MAG: MarR family winged helix-turn-helix transcriptional regulator [Candidatus Rifleibacteriota bacterium]
MEKFLPGKWIGMLYRSSQMHICQQLSKEGIGSGQYPFLMFIGRCGGCSQDEIAKNLCFDKGTTARALKKLEQEGFVRRIVSESDHRRREVFLTEKGKTMRIRLRKMLENWNDKLFEGIPDEIRARTEQILETMAQRAFIRVKDFSHNHDDQE